jgi:hypothetical protein
MKMKPVATTLLAAAILTAQAHASEHDVGIGGAFQPPVGFTETEISAMFAQHGEPLELAALSQEEMNETDGAVAPLVALGIIHAGRFVAQRWVTQRVAAQVLARGNFSNPTFGAWSQTSQQARAVANQAWQRSNVIRHGPTGHVNSKVNYSHYQHSRNSIGGHSYYGRQH